MNINDQVVSLELAQKLKTLGVKQDSLFYWGKKNAKQSKIVCLLKKDFCGVDGYYSNGDRHCTRRAGYMYSAFTVAELGEMLPWDIVLSSKDEVYLATAKDEEEWQIYYEGVDKTGVDFKWSSIVNKSEADARAKMLIYLLENKLITL